MDYTAIIAADVYYALTQHEHPFTHLQEIKAAAAEKARRIAEAKKVIRARRLALGIR